MFLLLALVFVAAPIVELYVIVQVAGGIGVPETILLLIAISLAGSWLAKLAGLAVLGRLQATVRRGEVPSAEIVDGALVLLPPSRAVVRGVVLRKIQDGGGLASVVVGQTATARSGSAEVWDVEGWEDPPERPGLPR